MDCGGALSEEGFFKATQARDCGKHVLRNYYGCMWNRRETQHGMVMQQAQGYILSKEHNMHEEFWEENHFNRSRKSPVAAAG